MSAMAGQDHLPEFRGQTEDVNSEDGLCVSDLEVKDGGERKSEDYTGNSPLPSAKTPVRRSSPFSLCPKSGRNSQKR